MAASLLPAATADDVLAWGLQFFCVWLLGLACAWLLPKPKWVDRGLKAKSLFLASPPGLWVRRCYLAAHGALILREVWRNLFAPGTFRGALRAAWRTLTTGQRFQWPQPCAADADAAAAAHLALAAAAPEVAAAVSDSWYISHQDLADFKATIDDGARPKGATAWEPMMQKQWPGATYTAWRRTLASGKAEYKSVTISEDATAEEYMDFNLDDARRFKWDSMISETQVLESGPDAASRCQVVRWLRTFPFAFISQREYLIARRFFREDDGSLYAVTRCLANHPAAPPRVPGAVRMEGFKSAWRSRTVACPLGSGRPACETTLLHFEDFQIPERLARFAVRHGMAGFVKGMIPAVVAYVAERRTRCCPTLEDSDGFGRRQVAPAAPLALGASPSLAHLARGDSLTSSCSSDSSRSATDETGSERSVLLHRSASTASMRRLGYMMVASGVAMVMARTASVGTLNASPPGPPRHSSKRHGAAPSAGHHQQHGKHHHSSSSGHAHSSSAHAVHSHKLQHLQSGSTGAGASSSGEGAPHRRSSTDKGGRRRRQYRQAPATMALDSAVLGAMMQS